MNIQVYAFLCSFVNSKLNSQFAYQPSWEKKKNVDNEILCCTLWMKLIETFFVPNKFPHISRSLLQQFPDLQFINLVSCEDRVDRQISFLSNETELCFADRTFVDDYQSDWEKVEIKNVKSQLLSREVFTNLFMHINALTGEARGE